MSRIKPLVLGGLVAFCATSMAQQSSYPEKPIRLVVPWPPGGNTDAVARLVADKLSARVHQSIVVDNRPGANGIVGSTLVARAPADGYTLLWALPETNVLNPMVYKQISYKADDFAPVAFIGVMPFALVVNPNFTVKSVKDLVENAKKNPGAISAASWGVGSTAHAAIALTEQSADVKLLHVPFPGTAAALTQVLSGQVNMMFLSAQQASEYAKAGKLATLGVTSAQRVKAYPEIPTLAEQGLPGVDVALWYGIVAPVKTPTLVINRLNREINEVLNEPDVKMNLQDRGLLIQQGSAEEFGKFMNSEKARWGKLIKAKNIQIDN